MIGIYNIKKIRLESQNQHEDENKSCIFKVFDDIR